MCRKSHIDLRNKNYIYHYIMLYIYIYIYIYIYMVYQKTTRKDRPGYYIEALKRNKVITLRINLNRMETIHYYNTLFLFYTILILYTYVYIHYLILRNQLKRYRCCQYRLHNYTNTHIHKQTHTQTQTRAHS